MSKTTLFRIARARHGPVPAADDYLSNARREADRTTLRQSLFAKWDGQRFVYGAEAAVLRTGVRT